MCHDVDRYSALSANLAKVQLLARLSPVLESDQEYVHALALLLAMVSDYADAMRKDLDRLMLSGDDR